MRFEKIKYMYKCFLKKHFGMYSLQTINSCPFFLLSECTYGRKLVVTALLY